MTDQLAHAGRTGRPDGTPDDPGLRLEPADVEVYRFFLEAPASVLECSATVQLGRDNVECCIRRLSERRLLRPSLTDQGTFEAVSPELAAAELAAPMQARAHQLMLESEAVRRELSSLSSIYRASQRKHFAYASTEVLVDSDKVRQRLKDLATQVQSSLLAAHPTMPPA